MATLISFPEVLTPHDGHRLDPEAEMRAVRAQAAVVRSLLDEVELLASSESSSALCGALAAQTVEELTQLAWRMVQTAAAISPHRVIQMSRAQDGEEHAREPERIAG
jgi:hypothetical protein